MKPIPTVATNKVLVAPGCDDLPVAQGDGFLSSYWKPNAEELAALNAGLPIKLSFLGTTHPPVAVEVEAL